jgi:3-hydroxyisobutyrate dehydrogenase
MLCIFIYLHIRSVKKGTVLIDSSTVDPDVSKTVAATAEAQGTLFLDAPVSGGEVFVHY